MRKVSERHDAGVWIIVNAGEYLFFPPFASLGLDGPTLDPPPFSTCTMKISAATGDVLSISLGNNRVTLPAAFSAHKNQSPSR